MLTLEPPYLNSVLEETLVLGQENKIFSFSGFSSLQMMQAGSFLFIFYFIWTWSVTNYAHLSPTSCK